jgi:hypothetical protein
MRRALAMVVNVFLAIAIGVTFFVVFILALISVFITKDNAQENVFIGFDDDSDDRQSHSVH